MRPWCVPASSTTTVSWRSENIDLTEGYYNCVSMGATVYIEAPARFDAVSGNRLLLRNGRLSASVPPEGLGFTVDTPDAEVIDFGTEFSIEVESSASEVHVFEGLVRVQPRSFKDGHFGRLSTSNHLRR